MFKARKSRNYAWVIDENAQAIRCCTDTSLLRSQNLFKECNKAAEKSLLRSTLQLALQKM